MRLGKRRFVFSETNSGWVCEKTFKGGQVLIQPCENKKNTLEMMSLTPFNILGYCKNDPLVLLPSRLHEACRKLDHGIYNTFRAFSLTVTSGMRSGCIIEKAYFTIYHKMGRFTFSACSCRYSTGHFQQFIKQCPSSRMPQPQRGHCDIFGLP